MWYGEGKIQDMLQESDNKWTYGKKGRKGNSLPLSTKALYALPWKPNGTNR